KAKEARESVVPPPVAAEEARIGEDVVHLERDARGRDPAHAALTIGEPGDGQAVGDISADRTDPQRAGGLVGDPYRRNRWAHQGRGLWGDSRQRAWRSKGAVSDLQAGNVG